MPSSVLAEAARVKRLRIAIALMVNFDTSLSLQGRRCQGIGNMAMYDVSFIT
jgi:hypothetical protein